MTLERARALLAIARDVSDPAHPLGVRTRAELRSFVRLSPEGIDLALGEYLETSATEEQLTAIFDAAAPAAHAHVLLSANVCTAALRAILLGCAAGERVSVRPSRRDPVLAQVLVEELSRRLGPAANVRVVRDLSPAPGDVVHAYGSDGALAEVERALPAGARFHGHGTGFGVAAIAEEADLRAATEALAEDVVVFDQAGCLSPRIAVVAGGSDRGADFARLTSAALTRAGRRVPRGPLDDAQTAELARFVRVASALGEVREEADHIVTFLDEPAALLPPAARAVVVVASEGAHNTRKVLGDLARFVTSVGLAGAPAAENDALRPLLELRGVRVAPLGKMQKPPLDGPVDRRRR